MPDHYDRAVIRRATVDDTDTVTSVVTAAWLALPHSTWLVDSNPLRSRIFASNAAMWIEHARIFGQVDIAEDGVVVAVAVWFDRTHRATFIPDDYKSRLSIDCDIYAERFAYLDGFTDGLQPRFPHHHLLVLAITAQGSRGLMSALLRRHHEYLDGVGVASVVRVYSPDQVTFFEQQSYRCIGRHSLGESGPMLWIMHRLPLV